MKIASFDIGIKNMAYCVFETHSECLPNIIDWGVVNLTNDEVHFCSGLMKNAQPCKSKAKYRGHQNTEHFLCEKHVKAGDFIFSLSHIKKKKKSELIEFLKSHFISCENMNRDELMEKSLELCQRKLLVKIEKSNANFVDLVKIGQCIKEKFNASYKDIPDEKFSEVIKYIDYLKKNPN